MYIKVGDIDIFYTIAGADPTCLVPSLAGTPIYERTFTPALPSCAETRSGGPCGRSRTRASAR